MDEFHRQTGAGHRGGELTMNAKAITYWIMTILVNTRAA